MTYRRLFLCFFLVVGGATQGFQSIPLHQANTTPSPRDVDQAIGLAAGYLERVCHPDGRFSYLLDISSGQETSSYNIIRHAGAIYALGMLNHSHPDPQVTLAMVRAAEFMRKNYVEVGPHPDQLVVWERPLSRVTDSQHPIAELGATSLGIVALAAVREVSPKSVTLTDLQAFGHFVLFLQRSNGSFVSKYRKGSGPISNFESLYYPGEAALAFVTLYEADHSTRWLSAACRALSYLAKSRSNLSTVPADHWSLIATAKLLPYCEQGPCTASRAELVRHAIQICDSMLRDEVKKPSIPGLVGAFEAGGRTTPTATRLEGLLASLEFLPKGELRTAIEAATTRGIAFLLRAQIKTGANQGGMPGVFLTGANGATAIRIDYVQHAMSAWIRYQNLFLKENSGTPTGTNH
jgi:hypothetical protein